MAGRNLNLTDGGTLTFEEAAATGSFKATFVVANLTANRTIVIGDQDVVLGSTTITGPKGDRGDTGLTGPQGIQGIQGNPGPQGAIGPLGPKGDQGMQGIQGDMGLQGPVGATGSRILAAAGYPNANLGNAGDFYVDTSTGNTFLKDAQRGWQIALNIVGPPGERGTNGAQGAPGPQGNSGADGQRGATGLKGDKGDTGIGLIPGGTTGQALVKASGSDYDFAWGSANSAVVSDTNPMLGGNLRLNGKEVIFNGNPATYATMLWDDTNKNMVLSNTVSATSRGIAFKAGTAAAQMMVLCTQGLKMGSNNPASGSGGWILPSTAGTSGYALITSGTSGVAYWQQVTKPADLAIVATSGSYADLINAPVLSAVATSGSYTDLSNRPAVLKDYRVGFAFAGNNVGTWERAFTQTVVTSNPNLRRLRIILSGNSASNQLYGSTFEFTAAYGYDSSTQLAVIKGVFKNVLFRDSPDMDAELRVGTTAGTPTVEVWVKSINTMALQWNGNGFIYNDTVA